MEIEETPTFREARARIPPEDDELIDRMLDRLEEEHEQPAMRAGLRVGQHHLWATPAIPGEGDRYRITWRYDDPQDPRRIQVLTVADVA